MDIINFLVGFSAVWGAILSTILAFLKYFDSLPSINIEIVPGINSDNQEGIFISIKNPSNRKVFVTGISLAYKYKKVIFWKKILNALKYKRMKFFNGWVHNHLVFDGVEIGLPIAIEPLNSHMIFLPIKQLEDMLVGDMSKPFIAVVQDALWKNAYSKTFIYKG